MRTVTPGLLVYRYPLYQGVTTPSDASRAVAGQLRFLTSREYVAELLVTAHGATRSTALARAKAIVPHAATALAYIDQALSGPAEVAFLPGYYAILNLVKVYILFSSRHGELAANRWHGAQYKTYAKASQSLLTEQIHIKRAGALPLFYEVMSGRKWGAEKRLAMREIYPYIADVGSEWEIATGRASMLAGIAATVNSDVGRELVLQVALPRGVASIPAGALPALRGVIQDPKQPTTYRRTIAALSETPNDMVRNAIDSKYVFHPRSDKRTTVALHSGRMVIFEEWPIALAFFHLSSVVRYKPEFLARLRDSRLWPVVAALPDALYRFLVLTWSFARQSTIVFSRE